MWRGWFFTPQGHWRVGWRVAFTALAWMAITLALSTLLAVLAVLQKVDWLAQVQAQRMSLLGFMLLAAISALATGLTLAVARRFWEPATWADWGLDMRSPWWRDVLLGFAVGGLMMMALAVALYLTGHARWQPGLWGRAPWPQAATLTLLWLVTFALVGWYEEALLRGYLYGTLAQGMPRWAAAVLSALVFAALHTDNPAFGPRAFVGLFAAGLFFAAVRGFTPWGLGLPVGVHWGWNFFEGVVLGFPVSGLNLTPWWQAQVQGPAWWTGGAFGPEAGLVLAVALAVGWFLLRERLRPAVEEGRA